MKSILLHFVLLFFFVLTAKAQESKPLFEPISPFIDASHTNRQVYKMNHLARSATMESFRFLYKGRLYKNTEFEQIMIKDSIKILNVDLVKDLSIIGKYTDDKEIKYLGMVN